MIRLDHEAAHKLVEAIPIVCAENRPMDPGHLLPKGTDVWLNTAEKARKADGANGMNATLNSALSLKVLGG